MTGRVVSHIEEEVPMKKRLSFVLAVIMLVTLATSVYASIVEEETFKALKPEHVQSNGWRETIPRRPVH